MNTTARFSFTLTLFLSWTTTGRGGGVVGPDSLVVIPGDVMLAAMFGTNEVYGGQCGDYSVRSLQEMLAVMWFVQSLNARGYTGNVTVGLEVFRTCKMPTLATKGIVSLLSKYNVGNDDRAENTTWLFGLIGPDRTSDAVAVSQLIGSLPTNQRLLHISGSVTGKQLNDMRLYPSFFRVIPSDEVQIQVILNLILQLQWNYVAIVFTECGYGESAATELRRLAEAQKVCVPVFESLPLDTGTLEFDRKSKDIAQLLKGGDSGAVLGLIYVGGSSVLQQFLPALYNARFVQLILSEAVGLQTTPFWIPSSNRNVSMGSLVTAPPVLPVPEFASVWNELWSSRSSFQRHAEKIPWLKGYFHQIAKCEFDDEDCWEKTSSVRHQQMASEGGNYQEQFSFFLGYQVKAAAVMMLLMKRVLEKFCGASFQGLCPEARNSIAERTPVQDLLQREVFDLREFASVVANFANHSVSFDVTDDSKSSTAVDDNLHGNVTDPNTHDLYNVYNLRKSGGSQPSFHKVGTFFSGHLSMEKDKIQFYNETGYSLTWNQLPPAQCARNHDCLACEHDASNDVIFIKGTFYILAILPVHAKNTKDPLKCGEVKSHVGADLAEAVVFAVRQVNDKANKEFTGVLPDRRVGLIGISSCGSSLMVKQRLLDIFSGRWLLPDGSGNSSVVLPRLMGVIGAFYSANSIAASETLTSLGHTIVQVSAASTSIDLKDRTRHPYFMRLVPADDKQAQVMLDIVQRLGANYIQVIYDGSSAYATGLFHKLKEETDSSRYRICIAQSITTQPHSDPSRYKYIVDRLRDKSAAKIVVIIMHYVEINKTMTAILPLLSSEDNFLFLASESWGRRQHLIQGRPRLDGSLVLSQEIAEDKSFEKYFDEVDPAHSVNSWLKYFLEKRLNCYMGKSFLRKNRSGPCPQNVTDEYVPDSRIAFHIKAVYALVRGFHKALNQYCGPHATDTCETLNSSKLVSAMHEVKLDLDKRGYESPVFDRNGDGLVGYKVLQVTRNRSSAEGDMVFLEVGQWTEEGLELEKEHLKKVMSVCPNPIECGKCFPPKTSDRKRTSSETSESGVPVAGVVALGASQGVVSIVLFLIVVYQMRRLRSSPGPGDSSTLCHNPPAQRSDREGQGHHGPQDTASSASSDYANPNDVIVGNHRFLPPPRRCIIRQREDGYLTPTPEPPTDESEPTRALEFENDVYDRNTCSGRRY